jgi:diguanylate cyclase (GGDEF)-like protein
MGDESGMNVDVAVHVSPQGVAILTPATEASPETAPRILFVNSALCGMYRTSAESFVDQSFAAFGVVERQHDIVVDLLNCMYEGDPFEADVTVQRKDGSEFDVELQLIPSGKGEWVMYLRDNTDSRQQMAALRRQAHFDPLTGLPNRQMLIERLDKALDAARFSKSSVALLLMDLDHFKDINDTFGHQHGDMLLKYVGDRLRSHIDASDSVARLGGDEFAIVMASPRDTNRIAGIARKILNSFQQPFVVEGQTVEAGGSIGIAIYPDHAVDARTLLRRADVAMYAAKEANSGYAFYTQTQDSRTPEEMSLVAEMRGAMERNEFEMYYQPKLHLGSGLMTRAEALIRWNHPRRGLLAPVAFIPIAERTGLIKPLTDWMINRVMQQLTEWHAAGAPVHVAVNVSAKSLREQTLPAKIQSLLDKWKLEPRFLKIEITETGVVSDPAHALAIMAMMQSMGLRLSLDDFGTGYSSLTHLRQLPVDEIKIDKSFVMAMLDSEADTTIVRTIVDLGRNLGKQVCAEGVETQEIFMKLKEMNCDLAQGYWISKPVPAAKLIEWLVDSFWGMKKVSGL